MDQMIEKILSLFFQIVDRLGTKCAVTIIALAGLGYGTYDGIVPPLIGVIGMVVVTVAYMAFDFIHKKGNDPVAAALPRVISGQRLPAMPVPPLKRNGNVEKTPTA